jgi:S1-C subfamily serine protease
LITGVEENSPAAEAGIRAGDILRYLQNETVEGKYAEQLPDIWRRLADLTWDKPVSMKIQRGDEMLEKSVIPEDKGKLEGEDFDCRRWNMTVKEINKYRTPRLFYLQKKGVYIQGVKYPGNAASAGLQSRDIILKIEDQPMPTILDVKKIYSRILKDERREKKVMFEILRGGLRKWIVLDYHRDYDEE